MTFDVEAEREKLLEWQPHLESVDMAIKSPTDVGYNCIAFAAEDETQIWSPAVGVGGKLLGGYYWPDDVPKLPTVAATEAVFAGRGFVRTSLDDIEFEIEVDKVAIFGYDGMGLVTHAARQVPSGLWASKMGDNADIEHSLRDIEGGIFGEVRTVMRKDPEAQSAVSEPTPQLVLVRRGVRAAQ